MDEIVTSNPWGSIMHHRWFVATLIGVACGTPVLAAAQEEPVVTFRFAWPAGLEAEVEASNLQIRALPGGTDTTDATVRYRMRVRSHDEGKLVDFDDFEPIASSGFAERAGVSLEAVSQQLGAFMPGLIVSDRGELIRLDNAAQLRQQMETLFRPMFDSLIQINPSAQRMLNAMLSEQYFLSKAAEDWNALVGIWADAEYELGAVYEMESEEPSPLFPNVTIPFHYEFSLINLTKCPAPADDRLCATLEMASFPDDGRMRDLLSAMVERMSGRPGQIVYEDFQVENLITLVAEPETLVPHVLEITQSTQGRGREGNETAEFSQVRVRRFEYRYEGSRE